MYTFQSTINHLQRPVSQQANNLITSKKILFTYLNQKLENQFLKDSMSKLMLFDCFFGCYQAD